jgi:hypothetical protein
MSHGSSALTAAPCQASGACDAVFTGQPDLDQFVVVEGLRKFGYDGIGDALVADHDDRFQCVG